uniref:Uncharacterized protein n=1 Tax=Haptolina ericina TaxID=156174 RepID=A0A7S3FEY2_9EUKA
MAFSTSSSVSPCLGWNDGGLISNSCGDTMFLDNHPPNSCLTTVSMYVCSGNGTAPQLTVHSVLNRNFGISKKDIAMLLKSGRALSFKRPDILKSNNRKFKLNCTYCNPSSATLEARGNVCEA